MLDDNSTCASVYDKPDEANCYTLPPAINKRMRPKIEFDFELMSQAGSNKISSSKETRFNSCTTIINDFPQFFNET